MAGAGEHWQYMQSSPFLPVRPMGEIVTVWLHYLAMMTLLAALAAEHLLFKPPLDHLGARRLIRVDLVYGLSALVVLVTGILRVLYFGKGPPFYFSNPVFHAKFGVFLLLVLVSIYPTLQFLGWRRALRRGQPPDVSMGRARSLIFAIRLELVLVLSLPLLAVLMARGYGL